MIEKEALIILNAISGLGNSRIKSLIEFFGSALNVLDAAETKLCDSQILPADVIKNILQFKKDEFLKKEYQLMAREGVEVLSYLDESYPQDLKQIPDFPVVLYVKGALPENLKLSIGIVGSRQASLYGLSIAEKFAVSFAELGITVVSGMARGIDTAAHKGILKAKGATVAVLGSGLKHIYPPENKDLFKKISQQGAVLSEFSMDTEPFPYNFPRRNRIISGLSLGVVVIEAGLKSGALITASCALEQGKEVYAVPGKIDSPSSVGVNNLIKQGAKLVTSVEDILEDLQVPLTQSLEDGKTRENILPEKKKNAGPLTIEEKAVYDCLTAEGVHIDEIVSKSGLSSSQTTVILMKLELKRLIKQSAGKFFSKNE
ncbi:MAG TPA: DNA-processing protein DprA [Candidatus Omnitrophota bacterium]|nr:DNA-processing protein DprA [Candidatus Omnitrophota bacterium]HPN87862.1 DNA-processing protein DprA [Candidatus Omnitrophota bacterium]